MPGRPAPLSASPRFQIRFNARRMGALFACVFVGLALAGCAAQMAYRQGKDLVAQGKVEEGLTKFQEAVTHEPRGVEYRSAYLQTRDRLMISYLEEADRLASDNKWSDAEKLYQRALAIDPNNDRARAGLRAVDASQRHIKLLSEAQAAWDKKDAENTLSKLRHILTENPNHAGALALKRSIAETTVKPPAESAVLSAAYAKPITIEFKDVALKQVFEVISRTSGLNFLFDKDVRTDQKTSIFLKNSTIASAVHFTLLTNQLEQQVLDGNTILIYPNTPAKQKDYQEMVVKTFFLSNAEAKAVANTLKTIVKTRDVVVDEKLNMLIMRDSPEAIRLAEKLVAIHDVAEPEVMLEVEILEVKRSRLQDLGIKWPDSLTLTPLTGSDSPLTLRHLGTNLNSGTIGAGVGSVLVNARQQDSVANILANPRIRVRNHEKAKIMIGERVPNITVTTTIASTATSPSFLPETITYIDVGLTLDVEPVIYLDNDVAIKISLEVSSIVNQVETKSGSLAYQIGTRKANTVLRLKDGENQVLAGLINDEDRRGASKVPLIGEIPLLGRLFGNTMDNGQKTEIVLSITPRLIRNIQRPDAALSEFRAGTDSSLRTRPDAAGFTPVATPPSHSPQQGTPQPARTPVSTPSPPPSAQAAPAQISNAGTASGPLPNAVQLRWQGPEQVKAGSTFSLQLAMQSDQPITSLPIAVGFDNAVLRVAGVAEGDFLKQGGAQTNFTSRVEPTGQILMTATRSGTDGATGSGVVANINFLALTPADASRIQLLTVAPIGAGGHSVTVPLPAPHALQVQP